MKCVIEKLDYEGRGLCHVDGKVVFASNTLPEEVVELEIEKQEKNYDIAKVVSFYQKSEHRLPSFCPHASICGGCRFSCVSYAKSLEYKKEIIKDLFSKNGFDIPDFFIEASRPVLEYRNKVSLKVQDYQYGYYQEETHQFVPIKKCFLLNPSIQKLLDDFSLFSFQNGNLIIKTNQSNELLLDIETEEELKIKEELVLKHSIKGIIWNGSCVYGQSFLEEKRSDIIYQIPAQSFFQINPYISEKIQEKVNSLFDENDEVYDLYCGVGFFSLRLAKKVKNVIGIELSLQSILGAKANAMKNHIENVSFHVGKVEDILPKLKHKCNKVIVDPPRSGLKKSVINALLEEELDLICYISCNPITLVRDLKLLTEKYQMKFIQGYDMFSYTKHTECLCVLEKK